MRGLSTIIVTLFFSTAPLVSSSFAIDYATDFLEPGNPGGWETSLKTFDADQDVAAGETFDVEIWIRHVPSALGDAHSKVFYLDFTGYADKIAYVSAGRTLTDGSEGVVGPWTPDAGTIINELDGAGTLVMIVANLEGATPDADGDIILGKITFESLDPGDAYITVDRGNWVTTWQWDLWSDEEYNPATLVIHQSNDIDNDGIVNDEDNCPDTPNPSQTNSDSDTHGDACDNCPLQGNPGQRDFDEDGAGDVCDPDDDNDGICDPGESDSLCSGSDVCPYDEYNDFDEDGLCANDDNCPRAPNGSFSGTCIRGSIFWAVCTNDEECGDNGLCSMNQQDTYPLGGNGAGDACECESDFDCDSGVDADDVSIFLTHFGRNPFSNPCTNENQCKGDFICDGDVDGVDITKFLEDFPRGPFFKPCSACQLGDWCVYP